jgi:hypothetical protein
VFLCYRSWIPRTHTSRFWRNSVASSLGTNTQVCTVENGLTNIFSALLVKLIGSATTGCVRTDWRGRLAASQVKWSCDANK